MIDAVTSNYGLHKIIQDPTHILNSSSACINLIYTSQLNLIIESGVHSPLHPNYHHQVVFAKFNLSVLHRFMVKPHTSDIRMTYDYIRVRYEYIQITYE